jgi:hypothetical protein
MRTLIATYAGDEAATQAILEAIHRTGLSGQNVLVIARDERGGPFAHSGLQQTTEGEAAHSLHELHSDSLWKLLSAEYGDSRASQMFQTARDGRTLIIVYADRYLVEPARQALQAGAPLSLSDEELAFKQHVHPSPHPDTLTPSPHTADFYSAEELDPNQHTFDRGVEFDTRRSPYHDHYNRTYAPKGWPFERIAEAYHFGATLRDQDTTNASWDAMEAELREHWLATRSSEVPWEDVHEAVRHAWAGGRA